MEEDRAVQIIQERDRELAKQSEFRALWQDAADLMYPTHNAITSKDSPGSDQATRIWDTTAVQDSQDMASGLSAALIPTGQKFFGLKMKDRDLNSNPRVQRYLQRVGEIVHDELFESNFMLHLNESLRSLAVLGTCGLYSEFDAKTLRLNYRDYDIATFQVKESSKGDVDTLLLSYILTARQAVQEFGDRVSEKVREAVEKPETVSKPFEFIRWIGPRGERNPRLEDSRNMPFASLDVDVTAKQVIKESGFPEFPFAVARWMKRSGEKYGRGQGTENLPAVRVMQQIMRDFVECGNRWNNPALEVLDSFEGTVNLAPRAINRVMQLNTIMPIPGQALGSFPITREMVDFQQDRIHRAFFRDIFVQIADLTQRMTTVEVMQRVQEGLRRLAQPVARLYSELLTPVMTRSIMLLYRNGRLPPIPVDLEGQPFAIEYVGQLALALRDQQAMGFQRWASFCGSVAEFQPDALDTVAWDRALPRMAESFGVNTDDIATPEEVLAKREARAKAMQAQQMTEAVQAAGGALGRTTRAPESGSPAEKVMEAVGAE